MLLGLSKKYLDQKEVMQTRSEPKPKKRGESMFRDCCVNQEARKTVQIARVWQKRVVSLCPAIFVPLRAVFCKPWASMKSGSVLPSPGPGSSPLLLPLYCQGQIESKTMVYWDMVRQIEAVLIFRRQGLTASSHLTCPPPYLLSHRAHWRDFSVH